MVTISSFNFLAASEGDLTKRGVLEPKRNTQPARPKEPTTIQSLRKYCHNTHNPFVVLTFELGIAVGGSLERW